MGPLRGVRASTPAGPDPDPPPGLRLVELGRRPYREVLAAMQAHTEGRGPAAPDEIWLVEHPPVLTLGRAADPAHVLAPGPIPVVRADRGGQVTYHGPGQVVMYVLLDLKRLNLGVKRLVECLEGSVIDLLAELGLAGRRRPGAPGVYVDGRKIAALGLRVRRGCTYHGLALNVDVDLAPFARIDPCGYPGLGVTRLADLGVSLAAAPCGRRLAAAFAARLGRPLLAPSAGPGP